LEHLHYILVALIFFSCTQVSNRKEPIINEKPKTKEIEIVEKVKSIESQKTYQLEDIKVTLTQIKSDTSIFNCKSTLVTSKNNIKIDSISFTPESVGGLYGISIPNRIENHLIFTKHGDYDGRTLLVNEKGIISNIIGGENYFDIESKLLFTIYSSDISGFAIFDLASDSLIFEFPEIEDRPISFHKEFGERYFMISSHDESEERAIWEIEFDLERIMQMDLDSSNINQTNVLYTWSLENVNCECEK